MSVRVLIVDDEALARQRVRRLLQNEADVEIVGEAESGHEAVGMIRDLQPDLVCLDVQMPGLDGFGVLRELEGGHVPMVLFITAYDEHAQRAFDVHAVDYVLKPVDADRFRAAFDKARRQRAHAVAAERLGELLETVRRLADGNADGPNALLGGALGGGLGLSGSGGGTALAPAPAATGAAAPAGNAAGTGRYASRILVKQDGRMFFVKTTEIDWIEADRNYVRLHVGKQAHTIRERISHLEETLDPRLFARIHRSTIVNLNRVREMQQWFSGDYVVILEDGTRLRLSRHYRDRVEKQVGV
ncbi:LytTR family DNA-binding domain-containing protein [Gemmatimonas aurantiaca]|uniref:LytR/AlgR family response regulator transcription factor n=1 Tax=Gemmatimonas aurantiaca TaxID=173480 RepID=UPI00301C4ABE